MLLIDIGIFAFDIKRRVILLINNKKTEKKQSIESVGSIGYFFVPFLSII
jgi:hypothetical protein